jgi:hypothetical protein
MRGLALLGRYKRVKKDGLGRNTPEKTLWTCENGQKPARNPAKRPFANLRPPNSSHTPMLLSCMALTNWTTSGNSNAGFHPSLL